MTEKRKDEIASGAEPSSSIQEMSTWQKIEFIGWPLVWALISLMWFVLGLGALILFVLILTLFLMHRIKGFDHRNFEGLLAGLVIFALSSAGLWITASKLLQATRRKRGAGSFFPRGAELVAWKDEGQRRTLRKRLVAIGFLAWLSVGPTIGIVRTPWRHSPEMWAVAALMWLAAILFAIAAFPVRPEPRWLPPALAAVFGLTALISARLAMSSRELQGMWFFSALMVILFAGCCFEVFRSIR